MTRLWTGKGDDGTTGLLYGGRAPKSSPRFEAVGAVDEAQAAIGLARAETADGSELDTVLTDVCRDLWVLMAELATAPEQQRKLVEGESLVTAAMVTVLERVKTPGGCLRPSGEMDPVNAAMGACDSRCPARLRSSDR